MKKIITTIAIVMALAVNAFGMATLDRKVDAKKGKPQSFEVTNNSPSPVVLRAWAESETIRKLPEGAPDCSKNVKIFPKMIQLQPGEAQTFKILSNQAGYFRLFIHEEKLRDTKNHNSGTSSDDAGASINLNFRFGFPGHVE